MRFFFLDEAPDRLEGSWKAPAELQHHLKALRFGPEERFLLLPPEGQAIAARVAGKRELILEGGHTRPELPLLPITLATAWPKGKRAEDLVVRACEAGVARIQPVVFERSVAGREALSGHQLERLKRVAKECCQQLRRPTLPVLEAEPCPLDQVQARVEADRAYCLHPGAPLLAETWRQDQPSSAALLVGPEGGIAEEELARLREQEWGFVGLLPTILRIEAAGPLGAALCQHLAEVAVRGSRAPHDRFGKGQAE